MTKEFDDFCNKILKEINQEPLEEKEKWSKDIKLEKGAMHKALGIPDDKKVSEVYTSGKELAKDLVAKVGKKKAAGMINFAANINPKDNVFDKAQRALDDMEEK